MGLWHNGGYLHHHNGYGWGWIGMSIVMIILLVLLIVLVVFVARALYRGRHGAAAGPHWGIAPPPAPTSPQQVLAERFARGEIDAEEYRQRLTVLQNPTAPPEQPPPGS